MKCVKDIILHLKDSFSVPEPPSLHMEQAQIGHQHFVSEKKGAQAELNPSQHNGSSNLLLHSSNVKR